MLGICLMLVLALSLSVGFAAETAPVEQTVFYSLPYYSSGFSGVIFGEILNTSEVPIEINGATFTFLDPDGFAIASDDIYSIFPEVIPAGGKGFYIVDEHIDSAKAATDIADYQVTLVRAKAKEAYSLLSTCEFVETLDYNDKREITLLGTIENNTEALVKSPSVVWAVYDTEGKLLCVDYEDAYAVHLYPGSKIMLEVELTSDITDYLNTNEIEIGEVVSVAWYEN
jgi:hypothetical protein